MKRLNILLIAVSFFTTVVNAVPEITISQIPPLGENGYVEGKIIWDELSSANSGQYAVIAMLHAVWTGGEGYYVKPYNNNYLNTIDANGNYSILITTGGDDANVDEIIFFFVERSRISDSDITNPSTMSGKYLATKTIFRSTWTAPPVPPVSSIRPGFVAAGTEITLSCKDGGSIRYTLDGSNPVTSSTAKTYNNQALSVPINNSLLVKATTKISDTYSPIASFVWFPEEPLKTPFWGLNVSMALNGENFGYNLSEETTRERMLQITRLTKWIRTFGTIMNGQEYINKIAKESGLFTMIGLYITNEASNNNAQIEGLRQILRMGPTPDLIAVGNETSLSGVNQTTLASCIDVVRSMVLEEGLVIPIGTVDIANISWPQSFLEKLDFIGLNTYNGTWDNTPENQMMAGVKQTYTNTLSTYRSKLILLTETGSPYNGGRYSVSGGWQTPSEEKAARFLCEFLEWIKQENIPSFYFEAYDEPIKSQQGGHAIEQYFGIMDGNLKIHSFYCDCLPCDDNGIADDISENSPNIYPNPFPGTVRLAGIENCILTVITEDGVTVHTQKIISSDENVNLEHLAAGVYFFRFEKGSMSKTIKAVKKSSLSIY